MLKCDMLKASGFLNPFKKLKPWSLEIGIL